MVSKPISLATQVHSSAAIKALARRVIPVEMTRISCGNFRSHRLTEGVHRCRSSPAALDFGGTLARSAWNDQRMTARDDAPACLAYLLVPDATRQHVLVAAGADSTAPASETLTLPVLSFDAEPSVRDVLAAIDPVDPQTVLPLRISELVDESAAAPGDSTGTDEEQMPLLVEFDAVLAEAPACYSWRGVDTAATGRMAPSSARAAVTAWVYERDNGWSPQRPAWSRPGWHARASAWMVEQMSVAGRPATSAPRLHHVWDLSVVLQAESAQGRLFLKCSAEIFRHECVVTRALAAHQPDLLPEVVAVEPDQGWLLMRDLGAAELGDQDEALWFEGVVALAGLQQEWLGRTAELTALGLPTRSLATLAEVVRSWSEDDEMLARMSAELRARWDAAAPALEEDCLRLDRIGPGSSILHGDFHPWNVTFGAGRTRIFDWTDACASHPFVDLATYVYRAKQPDVRRQLMGSYLARWNEHLPDADLAEAGRLALVVGALDQVQTYRTLRPTLMAGDVMYGADVDWVKRALTRRERGLDSPT
jgi:hypothetical protein